MRSMAGPLTKFLIFVVITVLATGLLVVTISNADLRPAHTYTARFTDVTALNEGDDVRIAGVKVGQVESIRVADRKQAEVTFTVADRKLPSSVRAAVKYRNLVGQRYIALSQGTGNPNVYLPDGGTIPIGHTKPALDLTALLNGFKPLFQALQPKDVNKLSYEIIQVLQGEGGTMQQLLAHTASLTKTIASRDKVIGDVVNNLNNVLETVNNRDQELSDTVAQLRNVVSGLAEDRKPIGEAISSMSDLTNTTAGLVGQARKPLRKDINALGDLSQNLNDNEEIVDRALKHMPNKLDTITRTATYGSWFNFYACSMKGTVGAGNVNVPLPLEPVTQSRCKR